MRVSVIVPVYNVQRYLETMLDSILAQSFGDFELILVDDGSTDDSGKICDCFAQKDDRVRVFHIRNQGVSHARNFGLAQAKAEYIHFADADDVLEPGMYAAFDAQAEQYPADVIMCGCQQINVAKKRCTVLSSEANLFLQNGDEIGAYLDQIREVDLKCLLHYIWNKWYKRELLVKYRILFPLELSLGEDFVFNCGVFQRVNHLAVLSEPYYRYFIRGGALSRLFRHSLGIRGPSS